MATNLHPKIEQFEIQSVAASWDGCCCAASRAMLDFSLSQVDSRHRQIIVIECTAALAMSTSVTPAANCNWKAEETWASTLRQHMNGPQTLRMTVGGRRTRGRRNGPNMEMSCSQKRKLTRRGKARQRNRQPGNREQQRPPATAMEMAMRLVPPLPPPPSTG